MTGQFGEPFLVSIVIPTYNRAQALAPLLSDAEELLQQLPTDILQIVVSDNCSSDGTGELLREFSIRWGTRVKVIHRKVNLGMEGNIACAMMDGDGTYTWMLSDHQRICIDAAAKAIRQISNEVFDLGHAKLVQWRPALKVQGIVQSWDRTSSEERGAFLFSLGNLSTLIFRRQLGLTTMKSVFRACVWSYPHLGIISGMNASTRIIEFPDMSRLPEGKGGPALVHDYDKLSVRFRSNLECVNELATAAGIDYDRRAFCTPDYCEAFKAEVLNILLSKKISIASARRSLWPIAMCNQGRQRWLALTVLSAMVFLPVSLRLTLASKARNHIIQRRRAGAAP